jgi:hypothetical protein
MNTITVSDDLAEQLRKSGDIVDLVDENGDFVGLFRRSLFAPLPYDPATLPPPLSPAEFERRKSEGPLLTTDEVRARLKALE